MPKILAPLCLASAVGSVLLSGATSFAAPLAVEDFGHYVPLESDATLQGRLALNNFDGNPIGAQLPPDSSVSGIHNYVSSNANGSNRVVLGDLSYPGYVASGGQRMQAYGGGVNIRAQIDTAAPTVFADYLDNGVIVPAIGKTGTTLYVSFLYKVSGTDWVNSQAIVQFHELTAAPSTFSSRYQFGQSYNNSNILAQGTTLEAVNNNTHLVVMKIVYNGTTTDATDQVSLWYDPNVSLAESSQTIDASHTRNMTFTHMTFTGQGTASNALTKIDFDDLRFGTTWDSVVPVPEPTSLGLLAVTGMLFLRRKR